MHENSALAREKKQKECIRLNLFNFFSVSVWIDRYKNGIFTLHKDVMQIKGKIIWYLIKKMFLLHKFSLNKQLVIICNVNICVSYDYIIVQSMTNISIFFIIPLVLKHYVLYIKQ